VESKAGRSFSGVVFDPEERDVSTVGRSFPMDGAWGGEKW
jgi:hypothetical protein